MWKYVKLGSWIGCLCISMNLSATPNNESEKKKRSKKEISTASFSKKTIETQLNAIPICVDYKVDKALLKKIKSYTLLARNKTERTLGRTLQYFPIFEEMLKKYGLPEDLKGLAMIESAYRPTAESAVGASGLWQFMPKTAKQYGIEINDYVDERNNPYKSTEAAMKHLSKQYDRFGNWTLAIAAYNCGSGRMRSAIKKAKSRKYDKLKKYLPEETRKYVIKYVAANYVLNYYLFYDLTPQYPDYNYYVTEVVHLTNYSNFKNIQDEMGIAMNVLEKLNPAYEKGIIPPSKQGNYVILPKIGRKVDETKVLAKERIIVNTSNPKG